MCRMIGYAGPPVTLEDLLLAPPHSLLRQSWEPREQRFGRVNADGFGAGWYRPDRRPEPAVYRTTMPMWADRSFASIAGVVESPLVIAGVRSATPPAPVETTGSPPFARGPWLFALNGFLDGFREGRGVRLRRQLSEARDNEVESAADSEVVFALILDQLDRGAPLDQATAEVISKLAADNEQGGLNVLVADGRRLVATCVANSLYTLRRTEGGRTAFVVASEPFDDDPGWHRVPDGSLVDVHGGSLSIGPLG